MTSFRHLKHCFAVSAILLLSFSVSTQNITIDVETDKKALRAGQNEIQLSFTISNNSTETYSNLHFNSEIRSWRTKDLEAGFQPSISEIDPNENDLLEPGEIWTFKVSHQFFASFFETFEINSAIKGLSESGVTNISTDAKMIFVYGTNMDVQISSDCLFNGNGFKVDVDFITRLLIDEDAAKNPGTTTIIVGGVPIEIILPQTQWEARDLILTIDQINNGLPFDPFDPPAGAELDNFCEQGGVDAGRNPNNVLDECEPIETVRFPCVDFGEDDILCEFPDWVFCACIEISLDDLTIVASDSFTVWKAEESPPGSGNFGPFEDISANIETGGSDAEDVVCFVEPVYLIGYTIVKRESEAVLNWTTALELDNSHFEIMHSTDGIEYESIGIVEGSGTSFDIVDYEFIHAQPAPGRNYYYIIQHDFSGTKEKFPVRQLHFDYSGNGVFTVSPNPVENKINLTSDILIGQIQLILFDSSGKIVLDQSVSQYEDIDVTDLNSGVYLLKIYDPLGVNLETHKIIIAK